MRYIVETTVNLEYRAAGFVGLTPADAVGLVDLDESHPLVKSGAIVLHECFLDSIEVSSAPTESSFRASYSITTEIYGDAADLKTALDDGWLVWPEEIEDEDIGNEGLPLVLEKADFKNKVREDLTTGENR